MTPRAEAVLAGRGLPLGSSLEWGKEAALDRQVALVPPAGSEAGRTVGLLAPPIYSLTVARASQLHPLQNWSD